jgi:phytoene synthase
VAESVKEAGRNSSFAPAALLLPKVQRHGLQVLYAYCRQVDDAADEPGGGGRPLLKRWKDVLAGRKKAASDLEIQVDWFCSNFRVPRKLLAEIADGAESDLRPKVRFKTAKDLERYCHQVAGVVGQACLPLFGVGLDEGREFAETLGRAFQFINIIRDVQADSARNRIYVATEDLKKHGLSEKDWLVGTIPSEVVAGYGRKAELLLAEARTLRRRLSGDLKAADLMTDVYGELLTVMKSDGFRVFEKRYAVPGWKKRWFLVRRWLLS